MIFEWIEGLTEKQKEELSFLRRQSEKNVLLPVAEALGIDKTGLKGLRYNPNRILDKCIDRIERMQSRLKDLGEYNTMLRAELDAIDEGRAFFKKVERYTGI